MINECISSLICAFQLKECKSGPFLHFLLQGESDITQIYAKWCWVAIHHGRMSDKNLWKNMAEAPSGGGASDKFESPKWRDHVRGITGWERRERKRWREGQRGRRALTTNILFLAERMSRVWKGVARLRTLQPVIVLVPKTRLYETSKGWRRNRAVFS